MTNPLEEYRQSNSLSYAELGRLTDKPRVTAMRHCKATIVPKAARVDYNTMLGIPLEAFEQKSASDNTTNIASQD